MYQLYTCCMKPCFKDRTLFHRDNFVVAHFSYTNCIKTGYGYLNCLSTYIIAHKQWKILAQTER